MKKLFKEDNQYYVAMQKAVEQNKQEILQKYKPEYQQEKLREYENAIRASGKFMPYFMYFMIILATAWSLFVIIYLTRHKIKEQFR